MNSSLSREPLGRMITLDSLSGYLLPSNVASPLTLPAINQPSLRTRGSGPSSTTRRPSSSQKGEDEGLSWEMPFVLPAAWPPSLGGWQGWFFKSTGAPSQASFSTFPPFLHHHGVSPNAGCAHDPSEVILGLMETETGTSSSDIIRFPFQKKYKAPF